MLRLYKKIKLFYFLINFFMEKEIISQNENESEKRERESYVDKNSCY